METYAVRVWVPDRPGALGQVASRIGSVGGDVVGIEILERGAGRAIDELLVTLPSHDLVPLLIAEIGQVDDAAVEDVNRLGSSVPEFGTAVLALAARLVEAAPTERIDLLFHGTRERFAADWVSLVDSESGAAVRSFGESAPDAGWLAAYAAGLRHLPAGSRIPSDSEGDVAFAEMPTHGFLLAIGRARPVLRGRERMQVVLLARVLDALDLS